MSEIIISKRCSICKQIKSLTEFYKHPAAIDGHSYYCKICQKAYNKHYQQTEKGKVAVKRYEQSENRKAARREYSKYRRIQHPKQAKAHRVVYYAIIIGKIPRPDTLRCHYCNTWAKEYHHPSYKPEHWLDIIPVCIFCHRKIA